MRKFLFSCTMLAAFGANAAADPFVSGSEPGWGKHLSSAQRRTMGFEDVPAALKTAGYDTDPQPHGVAGPGCARLCLQCSHYATCTSWT